MDDVDYGWPTDADGIIRMSGGILMNINLRQPQAHDTMFVSGTGQATKLEQLEEGRMAWTVDQVVYIGSHKPYEEMTHPGGLNVMFADTHVRWFNAEIPKHMERNFAHEWLLDDVDGRY